MGLKNAFQILNIKDELRYNLVISRVQNCSSSKKFDAGWKLIIAENLRGKIVDQWFGISRSYKKEKIKNVLERGKRFLLFLVQSTPNRNKRQLNKSMVPVPHIRLQALAFFSF